MIPIIYSDTFLHHDTRFGLAPGEYHPERPERLTAVISALKAADWSDQIDWRSPTPVPQRNLSQRNLAQPDLVDRIAQLQDQGYIEAVAHLAQSGGGHLDADTVVSPQSYDVALLAVSAWLDGVDLALNSGEPAFVLARPPGHHATGRTGMGFCIFSNAAIAAHYALEQTGVERVAVLDWDVHHGNGTQDIVQNNPQIAYCSLHQSPCYPGTGARDETGSHQNVLNLPLPPGSARKAYLDAFDQQVTPFLRRFVPDLLIVSAGYDATQADLLANMSLQPSDYGAFTRRCLGLTRRMVLGLEGGYDLDALGQSVVATLEAIIAR